MIKLCILSLLVVLVKTELNIAQFYGKWMPIIMYQNDLAPMLTKCPEVEVARKNNSEVCQCGDRNNVPVLEVTSLIGNVKVDGPVFIVNSAAEAESSLQMNCTCDGQPSHHATVRPINENYFIQYEPQYSANEHRSKKGNNKVVIYVKKLPSAAELKIMTTYDDLSGRQGRVLCLPVLFTD